MALKSAGPERLQTTVTMFSREFQRGVFQSVVAGGQVLRLKVSIAFLIFHVGTNQPSPVGQLVFQVQNDLGPKVSKGVNFSAVNSLVDA